MLKWVVSEILWRIYTSPRAGIGRNWHTIHLVEGRALKIGPLKTIAHPSQRTNILRGYNVPGLSAVLMESGRRLFLLACLSGCPRANYMKVAQHTEVSGRLAGGGIHYVCWIVCSLCSTPGQAMATVEVENEQEWMHTIQLHA